jgi:hypothetical protein
MSETPRPHANTPGVTERERLLLDAAAAIRERGESYGDPQAHFMRTVGAINAVLAHKLREPLTPADWGICMILDKCAREQHSPKRDNMTDVAGYAGCVAEIRVDEYAGNSPKADPSAMLDLAMSVEHQKAMGKAMDQVASHFAQAWSRENRETQ